MRVDTVEQFKVLQFIKDNFLMDYITVTLQDRYSLKVTDERNESLIFTYEKGQIKESKPESVESGMGAMIMNQRRVDNQLLFEAAKEEEQFDAAQLKQLELGLDDGVDIAIYADYRFSPEKMGEVRAGLKNGLDANVYADYRYTLGQMIQLRLGLENQVDTAVYCESLYKAAQMKEIRLGLEAGIDVRNYLSYDLSAQEMEQIRLSLENKGGLIS